MKKYSLYLAWLIATIGTIISLYYSEIAGHTPCKFCWFQRICLFPLPILLFPIIWNKHHPLAIHYLPLPLIGLSLSFFTCKSCTSTPPLAILSTIGFALIAALLIYTKLAWRSQVKDSA